MAPQLPQVTGTSTVKATGVPSVSISGGGQLQEVQAKGWSDLSTRMDQMSDWAFKIAGKQAEAKGLAYGAANAPTIEQIEQAKRVGKPIEIVGNPTSFSIYEQAAYAGSMAVIEDRYEIAGRRKLTEIMADAAQDPGVDPNELLRRLDEAVGAYSENLNLISPTSAAKVESSLGVLANSQVNAFSREYIRTQANLNKNEALINAGNLITDVGTIINGHVAPMEGTETADLKSIVAAHWSRIHGPLLGNPAITAPQIEALRAAFDKEVARHMVGTVNNWALQENPGNPGTSVQEILKHARGEESTLPPHIREIYDSMIPADQQQVIEELAGFTKTLLANEKAIQDKEEFDNQRIIEGTVQLFTLELMKEEPNRERIQEWIGSVRLLDRAKAEELEKIVEAGADRLVDNATVVLDLRRHASFGTLTLKKISDNADQLTGSTIAEMFKLLDEQRDNLLTEAKVSIKEVTHGDLDPNAGNYTEMKQFADIEYNEIVAKLQDDKRAFELRISEMEDISGATGTDFYDATQEVVPIIQKILEQRKQVLYQGYNNTLQLALEGIANSDIQELIELWEVDTSIDGLRNLIKGDTIRTLPKQYRSDVTLQFQIKRAVDAAQHLTNEGQTIDWGVK